MATVVGVSARTSVPSRVGARSAAVLRFATVVIVAGVVLAVLAMITGPGTVRAQDTNSLQSIDPVDGASLAESPTQIRLAFNQELAGDDAVTVNLSCSFQPQETGLPEVDADRLIVTVAINNVLPKGACVIAWSLKNATGDTLLSSTTNFTVTSEAPAAATAGDDAGAAAPPAAGATTTTDPFFRQSVAQTAATETEPVDQGSTGGALWLGRLLSTLGILVVFGGLALISVGWPEGPEYVVTVRFLRAAWILSLLGTVLYLVAYAADFNGTSLGTAISPGEWLQLNDAGWVGRGALMRFALIAGSGWVAMRPERIIDPQSAMWAWALPGFALVTVALERVDGPAAPIGFIIGIAHLLSVAVWFGGAALVARVVLAGPGEDDLVQATRTFSRISIPAILVACVTGIMQLVRLDGGDLFSTSHGRVLLLKVVAVAAMLAVALAVRQQVTLRLDRAHELTVPAADRFRRAFGAEAAFGVVALAFSGWLLGLTPANIDRFPGEGYTREIAFKDQATGLDAVVKIGPARVGANGFRVEVEAPAENINGLTLLFIPPTGSNLPSLQQEIPLSTSGTAQLAIADGLPFRVGGVWTLQLSVSTATGTLQDATATFQVFDADGNEVIGPQVVDSTPTQVQIIDQSTTSAPFATTTTTAPLAPAPPTSPPSG
jgi:putative copper export protein/methionine-rich copper-binding protein CopC